MTAGRTPLPAAHTAKRSIHNPEAIWRCPFCFVDNRQHEPACCWRFPPENHGTGTGIGVLALPGECLAFLPFVFGLLPSVPTLALLCWSELQMGFCHVTNQVGVNMHVHKKRGDFRCCLHPNCNSGRPDGKQCHDPISP